MLTVEKQLEQVIPYLSDREQSLLLEIALRFLPDDIATPQDLIDLAAADEEYARGEIVRHEDIDWDS